MGESGASAGPALGADGRIAVTGDASASAPACAVVVAGGSGKRFGNPGGKQLVEVAGLPLLSWSLRAFDSSELVGHIVVVVPEERRDEMARAAVEPLGLTTPVTFAPAGAERQDSTHSGLEAVPGGFEIVAIHDGARPLISRAVIDRAIRALADEPELDGVLCGQRAVDTLKIADEGGLIESTPPRERYWTVQTPQVFRREALLRAHEAARATGFLGTDDASLIERAGGRVRIVESPRDNMKVTLPEDLPLVEFLLRGRGV